MSRRSFVKLLASRRRACLTSLCGCDGRSGFVAIRAVATTLPLAVMNLKAGAHDASLAGSDEPLVVLSPHLDDAVFSCGDLLRAHPGSTVVTLLAGTPPDYEILTDWDRAAGFSRRDDVVAERRREDAEALRILGASPHWLPCLDGQYAAGSDLAELTGALEAALDALDSRIVLAPLGLFHSDHILVHAAAMQIFECDTSRTWYAYEDAIYRALPGVRAARLRNLRERLVVTHCASPPHEASPVKRRAIHSYRSQLAALALAEDLDYRDIFEPERCWRLARPDGSRKFSTIPRAREVTA